MERDTTMPSILGPDSGYGRGSESTAREKPESREASPVIKLVFWAAIGVLLVGAYRFFTR
jgi:hypothetical protein